MWAVIRYSRTPAGKVDHRTVRAMGLFPERHWAELFLGTFDRVSPESVELVRCDPANGARLPKFYAVVDDEGCRSWYEWSVGERG
jgi:hypothetical protein